MRPVHVPRTMEALWEVLSKHPDAALYAGGTDLLVRMRKGLVSPPWLVCLERVPGLRGVRDQGDRVFIGACTSHSSLMAEPLLRERFPILVKGLGTLGSPHIRNMGTIGGNIVTASPAGDTLPPLYALGAHLQIQGRDSSRQIPITQFIQGPGRTDLHPGEILAGVWVKKPPVGAIHHYEKVGQRKALAIAVASLAALLRVSPTGIIQEARLAWGSVGPWVVMSEEAEKALIGLPLTRETLEKAVPFVHKAVRPIDDIRASAIYRRIVAGNLLLRLRQYSEPSIASGIGCPSSGGHG